MECEKSSRIIKYAITDRRNHKHQSESLGTTCYVHFSSGSSCVCVWTMSMEPLIKDGMGWIRARVIAFAPHDLELLSVKKQLVRTLI